MRVSTLLLAGGAAAYKQEWITTAYTNEEVDSAFRDAQEKINAAKASGGKAKLEKLAAEYKEKVAAIEKAHDAEKRKGTKQLAELKGAALGIRKKAYDEAAKRAQEEKVDRESWE